MTMNVMTDNDLESMNLILDSIRNYFSIPWFDLNGDDGDDRKKAGDLLRKFVGNIHDDNMDDNGDDPRPRQNKQRLALLVQMANDGEQQPQFKLISLDQLKKWRKTQPMNRMVRSIMFIKFQDTVQIQGGNIQNVGQNSSSTLPVQIRLVTDKEAVEILSDILKTCPLTTKGITAAYQQLLRFIDREQVLEKLHEERTLFLMKLNDWSEKLLEYPSDDNNNDDDDDPRDEKDSALSPDDDENGDVGQKPNRMEHELNQMARKLLTLKQRQLLLVDILADMPLLFRNVSDLTKVRNNLLETSQMLDTETKQLFHRWTSAVGKNIQFDLTKPCIIINDRSNIPQITFSKQLERFAKSAAKMRELKFTIPEDIEQMEKHVQMYVGFVRDLRHIVRFYLTVADQILLCQRPMLIDKAKAFTSLLETKQQRLSWADGPAAIRSWIDELKQFMERFREENAHLKRLHGRILETVKWMVDVPFGQWAHLIEKVRMIMNDVDRNRNYPNTYSWRKHWDYQLYKILEFHFRKIIQQLNNNNGGGDGKRTLSSNQIKFKRSEAPGKHQQQQQQQQQWQQMIFTGNNHQATNDDQIELQFNPIGLVVYEPSFEVLKQNLFKQFEQFIKFPSKFRAFVDWSLDGQLNPSDSVQSGHRTLFYNIYYRNDDRFSALYSLVMNAMEELVEIRQQFTKWTSMYALIKSMKSIGYGEPTNDTVVTTTNTAHQNVSSAQRFALQTLEDYQHNLRLVKDLISKFQNDFSMTNEIRCKRSHLVVNIIPIKMFIEWLLNETETVLLQQLREQCLKEVQQVEQECRKIVDQMKHKPMNIQELIAYDRLASEQIGSIHSKLLVDNVKLREKIHFLKNWSTNSQLNSVELDTKFDAAKTVLNEMENIYQNRQTLLENHRESLQSKLSLELDTINQVIESFLKRWLGLADNIKQTPEVINDFQINCNQIMEKVGELRQSCEYFHRTPPKTFETMSKVSVEIQELYGKFHVLYEFELGLSQYQEMEWLVCRNKLKKINQYIAEWLDNHPSDDEYLKSYIERWQQFLSIVEICRGDSYQKHHWNQFMRDILEMNDKHFEDLKLMDLWLKQDKLMECKQEILEINKRAFNDNQLREALNDLNGFAYNGRFVLYPYQTKDKKQIMLIKEWHQCYNQISDCFLLLQTIKNMDQSEISDEYLKLYQEWEIKLNKFESLIMLLNSVQRKWISLEPIYHSVDHNSVGSAAGAGGGGGGFFNDVNFVRSSNDFQDIMRSIKLNDGKFAYLLNVNVNLETRLKVIDQNFSFTQKKLRTFIEESRQRFPRFYFLADEDLLLILSGNVDLNHSGLVKKLFVNMIGGLIYKRQQHQSSTDGGWENGAIIEAIKSVQGEVIQLKQPVQTDNNHGPARIEKWLQELDTQIKFTLRKIFVENQIEKHSIYTNHGLFARLPSQIISLYCHVDFTERVEDSIPKNQLINLRDEYEKILASMTKDGAMFLATAFRSMSNYNTGDEPNGKQNGEKLLKIKIKQVVLDLIHFIDVIESLLIADVHDQNHWCWQSQLRYYVMPINQKQQQQSQQQPIIRIRMGLAQFDYSFEYLGCLGDSKLVYTPLTNKCFLTLTQAMDLGLGGNPYGPAGTGKTESVKALGQYFGRQVLVFNCDEAIDVKSMTRILIGLIKCGNWGCFDEFNRLQLDVLSVLSSQIQEIQNAIKNRSKYVQLDEYGQVAINNNAAVFITLNPAGKDYGGRNRIPDNLKSLFLPVAMTIPDNKTIVQFLSLAEGFSDVATNILGTKIPCWFDFAQGSMSQQRHYDWGLRTIKACLESSGRRLNSTRQRAKSDPTTVIKVNDEINLVIDTLRQQIKSKLVDSDAAKFDGLIEAVFCLRPDNKKNEEDNSIIDPVLNGNNDHMIDVIGKVFTDNSLLSNEYQTDKILQLYEQIQTRFGVVMIGPSGSGKTTIWQMLKKTLEQMSISADVDKNTNTNNNNTNGIGHNKFGPINVVVINPKSMPRQQLFGFIDEDTREWHDGLFTSKSREIASRDDLIGGMNWLVFDGDIDPDWVEALNSVLDDNRVLTLPSGERIDFDWNKSRILFETTTLQNASPATISRLGVVSVDMIMINEMVQCYVAKKQLSFNSITIIQNYLDQNHQQLYLPISTARTLLEHLHYCQANNEDDYKAIERISGQYSAAITTAVAQSSSSSSSSYMMGSTETINNLVVTNTVRRYVEVLKPLVGRHICLVGPIGAGKTTLAQELLFTATDGQLLMVDCTPTSDVRTFLRALFQVTTIVHGSGGSQRLIRSQSGQPLWIFIKHFELLTYDKWNSNSMVSLLMLMLKYRGFYHPDTFEWLTLADNNDDDPNDPNHSRFQMVFTTTNLRSMDKRLLTQLHLIQLDQYSLDEIGQILRMKTKQINHGKSHPTLSNIEDHFPDRFMDVVHQLTNHRNYHSSSDQDPSANTSGEGDGNSGTGPDENPTNNNVDDDHDDQDEWSNLNFLKIGINILDSLKHHDVIDEQIVDFEMKRCLKNSIRNARQRQLISSMMADADTSLYYISVNGQRKYDQLNSDQFQQLIRKWINNYCQENDIGRAEWPVFSQTMDLVADLSSFLSYPNQKNDDTSADTISNVPIMMIVGPSGCGRKFLCKVIAHNYGYERIWSPDYIQSERHLKNELSALFTSVVDDSATGAGQSNGPETKQPQQQQQQSRKATTMSDKKILLLVDEIHFEILPYLRDQIYTRINQFNQYSNIENNGEQNGLIIRLVLTKTSKTSLDRLLWLRKARLHCLKPFGEQDFQKLTLGLIKSQIGLDKSADLNELVALFYPMFKHFQHYGLNHDGHKNGQNVRLYADFVQTFIESFSMQMDKTRRENERMRQGVVKLNQVAQQVKTLKEEALEQKQLLDAKRKEADDAFNLIMNSMHRSEDKKVELEDVQKRIKIETDNLKERKSQIDAELNQIEPVLQAAKAAIGGISSQALTEIRSLRAPPEVIRDILEGVLRLMGVNDTSWVSMKTFLARRGVKDEIMNFDCHKITPTIRVKVEQLLKKRSESFNMATAKRASAAAAPLAEWVKANVEYSSVLHKIEPLEIELNKLEQNLHRAQTRIKTLDNQLTDVDNEVDVLRERMQSVTVEAAQIEINLKKSQEILERSASIVNDLSDEHRRWSEQLEQIQIQMERMPYKCLLVAAYLTLACQQPSYSQRMETLQKCFDKFRIEPFSLPDYLGYENEEEMLLFGSKRMATGTGNNRPSPTTEQSAGIASSTVIRPLMIPLICDPAHKALGHFSNVEITRLTSKDWLKVLELGIRFGRTVILVDFQQFDVRLVPLILGTIFGSSDTRYWTFIGDKKIDYNPKFSLYLMADSLQHISPLTLSMIRVVNLSPSFGSISSQLLGHIINIKRPELESEKVKLDAEVRRLQKQLKELEAELLENLSTETGNILDNVPLVEKLKYLKKSAAQVQSSLRESDKLKQDLQTERLLYRDLAQFAADLYFSMQNLPKLCPMYYFGYKEFEQLFILILKQKTDDPGISEEELCSSFYRYVSRALFTEHRRTFRQFLKLRYPSQTSMVMASLGEDQAIQTIGEFFEEMIDDDQSGSRTSIFPKFILIITVPGADPTTEIRAAISRLGYYQLQMISMGNDALNQVTSLIQTMMMSAASKPNSKDSNHNQKILCFNNLHLVIGWLPQLIQLLTNQELDKITTTTGGTHQNRRPPLILVTESCDGFPMALLEMCIKFAYESAPGLRSNLRRLHAQNPLQEKLLQSELIQIKKTTTTTNQNSAFNSNTNEHAGKLLQSLEYLHAICCERRFYLPFGWTKNYEFSFNEFHFGCNLIDKVIGLDQKLVKNSYKVYQYLDGLFHQVIYGGKINFVVDENILKLLLKRCFHPNSDFLAQQSSMSTADVDTGHQSPSSSNNDLKILGLPLNSNRFRDEALEKRLKQNLQLLQTSSSSSMAADNQDKNAAAVETNNNGTNHQPKPKALSLNPSGIGYFRKLWQRLLVKCKIQQIDELRQEFSNAAAAGGGGGGGSPTVEFNFVESESIERFIEQFQQFELDFAKRLLLQIDQDFHIEPIRDDLDESLRINRTPQTWANVWLNGVEIAQDFLINLARIYMKLSRISSSSTTTTTTTGSSAAFNLTYCFHPKLFLNSLKQFVAKKLSTSIDRLEIEYRWNTDGFVVDTKSSTMLPNQDQPKISLKLDGISIEGALYQDDQLVPCSQESPFTNPMPQLTMVLSDKRSVDPRINKRNDPSARSVPSSSYGFRSQNTTVLIGLYSCSKRQTLLEHWPLKCPLNTEEQWIEMGVAMILGNFA